MKKTLLLLMTAMAFMFMGCSDDDEKNNEDKKNGNTEIAVKPEVVAQVEDLTGTVMFNSVLGYWYINVPEGGSYDNVTLFFPLNMESDYRKAGQEVLFSGDLYEIVQEITVPAGTDYYAIKLVSIESLSD